MTQLLKSGTKQLLESQEAQRLQTQTDSFLLSENTTEQMTVIFLCSYQEGKYAERHRNIEESKRDGEPHLLPGAHSELSCWGSFKNDIRLLCFSPSRSAGWS